MSGMRTVGVSQRQGESEKKKRKILVRAGSQPRNWEEFIHEFIGRQWVGSGRSEERGHDVIGVAKALSSISDGI